MRAEEGALRIGRAAMATLGTRMFNAFELVSKVDTKAELSTEEKGFIVQGHLWQLFSGMVFHVARVGADHHYIELCNAAANPAAGLTMPMVMAIANSRKDQINNFLNTFLAPIVGRLSDRYGRRIFLAVGKIGWVIWFLALPYTKTLFQRQALEAVCWGVLNAGNWSILGAMQSDVFGAPQNHCLCSLSTPSDRAAVWAQARGRSCSRAWTGVTACSTTAAASSASRSAWRSRCSCTRWRSTG